MLVYAQQHTESSFENGKEPGLKWDEKGKLVKGMGPGPSRPKRSVSIIGRIRQIFEDDPEQFEAYVKGVIKDPMLRSELIHQIDQKPKERLKLSVALKFRLIFPRDF